MLIEKSNSEYYVCRIPGLIITENKTLVAYYECRKELSDWADIDIKIIRSEDEGKTWETVTVINSHGKTLNNPVMFEKDGVLHFLFCKNYSGLYYCVSHDDGKTFSEPEDISHFLENTDFEYTVNAIGPGHGIVHNGNMIVPIWFAYNKEMPISHRPSFIRTLYSSDNGKTWILGDEIGKGVLVNPSEASLAVDCDNNVIISIRNENPEKYRAFAISKTGFSDWQNLAFHESLQDPTCQGSMYHTDGMIYHINCANESERKNLTVKISNDNFKTYKSIPVSEIAGYSDIAVDGDKIFVIYERNIFELTDDAGLHFEQFSNI